MHGFYDFTTLMIAAFSNNPNFSYQNCINSGDSIVLARHKRNGQNVYENDFITGSAMNPFWIKDVYDEIMGEGKYFELCQKSDKLFDKIRYGQLIAEEDITDVVGKIIKFTSEKCRKNLKSGIYTKEEARGIFNEVSRKSHMIYRRYNIRANIEFISKTKQSISQTQNRSNGQITPNDLSNLSAWATRNFPGRLSEGQNEVRRILLGGINTRSHNNR